MKLTGKMPFPPMLAIRGRIYEMQYLVPFRSYLGHHRASFRQIDGGYPVRRPFSISSNWKCSSSQRDSSSLISLCNAGSSSRRGRSISLLS